MSGSERPRSVTIISWILIVMSLMGFYNCWNSYGMIQSGEYDRIMAENPKLAAAMKDLPRPTANHILIVAVALVVQFIAAVLMLQGLGVGRFIYIGSVAIGFVYTVATMGFHVLLVPSLVVTGIIAFFLFKEPANSYFSGRNAGY